MHFRCCRMETVGLVKQYPSEVLTLSTMNGDPENLILRTQCLALVSSTMMPPSREAVLIAYGPDEIVP
jgi:hypothetical protein